MIMNNEDLKTPFHQNVEIIQFYDLEQEIGRGAFSVVRKAKRKLDGKYYAVKILQKKHVKPHILQREIQIMQKIKHKHVLSMIEVFETNNTVSIVLDLIEGGELFQQIVERGHFSEKDAASIVRQLLLAVQHLHENNVVHRDLKPENILITNNNQKIHIYVSDFGLSRILQEGDFQMLTQCGSLEYCAPEVLCGTPYDKSVDLWSIGVIAYTLLTGYFPFFDQKRDPAVLMDKICSVKYDWVGCPPTSDNAKDFVANLLVAEPTKRMTTEKALQHPWIKTREKLSSEHLHISFSNLKRLFTKKNRQI